MLDSRGDYSNTNPPLLVVGPAGGGKTAICLKRVTEVHRINPLARTWVVLATKQQRASFRRRLLNETGAGMSVSFGVEMMLFYDLCVTILDSIGIPPRRIDRYARPYLLRVALRKVTDVAPLEHYSSIAHTHGFEEAMIDLIEELQGNGVSASELASVANSPKERDIGRICSAYENVLQSRGLCDRSNLGQLAVKALDQYSQLGTKVDLLVVDGFDRLSHIQFALLERLTQRARESLLTLTYSEERSQEVHRHFAPTYEGMLSRLGCLVQSLEIPRSPVRAAPLLHLEQNLFTLGQHEQTPTAGAVAVLEAPNPVREVKELGRRIKRILMDGVPTESILVSARNLSVYGPLCREVFQEFGIPTTIQGGIPLASNPAIALIVSLVTLADDKFPRARLVELLRNPYLAYSHLTPEQVNILDRISREKLVISGRDQWLDALARRGSEVATDDDAGALSSMIDDLSDEQMDSLHSGLVSFLDMMTPPRQGSIRDYIRWVEGIIGPDPQELQMRSISGEQEPDTSTTLNIVAQARLGSAAMVARDIAAICELKRVLAGILAGSELADPARTYTWAAFRQDLLSAIGRASYDPDPTPAGRVVVAEAVAQRGIPRDYVFLLGLAEGNFPMRPSEDPLFSPSDRRDLVSRGIKLEARSESDELSLFYEITSLAKKQLVISRPYLDDTGNTWPPSPYVRAVRQLFADLDVTHVPLSHLPEPHDASSLSELCLSISGECSPHGKSASKVAAWLSNNPEIGSAWTNSCRTRIIERLREERNAGPHHGIIANAELQRTVANRLGDGHVWSVTQFNEYGECPFKFFAKRLLKLEMVEEPEEGFDQLHLGTINHRILELTYRRMVQEEVGLSSKDLPRIEKIFDEVASKELENAPVVFGFRPTGWWRQESRDIRKRLWRLIQDDVADGNSVQLFKQEVRFDSNPGDEPLLEIAGPAGKLKVRGQIDRIDRIGNGYRVIDYKSGSRKIEAVDQAKGRHTQMQVYLLAAKALLRRWGEPDGPITGFFRHIRTRDKSGEMALDDRVETTCQIIHRNVQESREGKFPVRPSKIEAGQCSGYCDYGNLCRF